MVPMSVALCGIFAQSGACVTSPFHMYGCFENSLFSNTFAGSKCPLFVSEDAECDLGGAFTFLASSFCPHLIWGFCLMEVSSFV